MLQALVDVTVDVLGMDKSMVSTWDVDARVMTLRASRNLGEPALAYIRDLFDRRTQSHGRTDDESSRRTYPGPRGLHLVPIIEAGRHPVHDRDPRRVSVTAGPWDSSPSVTSPTTISTKPNSDLLTALAERAAVAIGNAELHERAQQAASLEERQRLARELHDSVSQALYGIALGARTARTLLDRDPLGPSSRWTTSCPSPRPASPKCAR